MPKSPQERVRVAQEARRRANTQPGLPQALRQNLRKAASMSVALNSLETAKGKPLPSQRKKLT
jgi:hypothetical protein